MPTVLVPLADGFEEVEAITIIDLLRRAEIEVTVAALKNPAVRGAHGVTVQADTTLEEAQSREFDMIALPGGMPGAKHLREDARVIKLLQRMAGQDKYTVAICAAPTALAAAGLLDNRRATAYPGFLPADAAPGLQRLDVPVEVDGKIITSRGPGTAMDFALELIATLSGKAARDKVEAGLVRP